MYSSINWLTEEEYNTIMPLLADKCLALWEHENEVAKTDADLKDTYIGRVAYPNCLAFNYDDGSKIFKLMTNKSRHMLKENYYEAIDRFPDSFGTGNANDVLEALYLCSGADQMKWDITRYVDYLKNDGSTFYYYQNPDGSLCDDVLKLDFFRIIQNNGEFTGGLFHAFKHFSINEKNLSTNKDEINDIGSIDNLLRIIAEAFYKYERTRVSDDSPNEKVSLPSYDNRHYLQFVFYKEVISGVYFLKTCYVKSIK